MRESCFSEQHKAEKSQALSAAYRYQQHVWKPRATMNSNMFTWYVAKAFTGGGVWPRYSSTHPWKFLPSVLGRWDGDAKDNGKGKADRDESEADFADKGALGTAMDRKKLAAALEMCALIFLSQHQCMMWTGYHRRRLPWKLSSLTPPPLNSYKHFLLITETIVNAFPL